MKKIHLIGILLCMLSCPQFLKAQEINWRNMNSDSPHQVAAHFGMEYASVAGLSYGYYADGKLPFVIGTEIQIPFGKNLLDDWKIKVNGQAEIWHNDHFSWSIKPGIIFRHYASDAATLVNMATYLTTSFGYLRPRGGIWTELNYDRSFATHIQHANLQESYPQIANGWFGSTGGNFKFGLAGNLNFGSWSSCLMVGKIYNQNFKNNPTLSIYANLSVQKAF